MTPGLAGFIASGHDERAWDESVAGVLAALGGRVRRGPGAAAASPGAGRRTWLDTFDWRLYRAGLTLEYAGRPRGGELLLPAPPPARRRAARADQATAPPTPAALQPPRLTTQPVTGWQAARPHLMCELPDGPVASRIGDLVAPRALLPVVTVTTATTTYRLLNEDGKTVARLLVERAAIPGPQPAPLAPRLAITEVRGYPGPGAPRRPPGRRGARRRAGRHARVHRGAARRRPSPRRLLQQGRRGHHRRPARQPGRRDDPAPAARHHRGERGRRARRHRHRVPARPARLRAADPERAEAVRRRATGRCRPDRARPRSSPPSSSGSAT